MSLNRVGFHRQPLEQVEVNRRLLAAREALLSVRGDASWDDLLTNVVKDLLSPVRLLKGLYSFWRDVPEGWYLKLITLEQMAAALRGMDPGYLKQQLDTMQTMALQETHWAFRYAVVALWQNLLTAASGSAPLQQQIKTGSDTKLGCQQLLALPEGKCRGRDRQIWVARHASTMFVDHHEVGETEVASLTVAKPITPSSRADRARRASALASSMFAAVRTVSQDEVSLTVEPRQGGK